MTTLDEITKLREQVEGTDPDEAERLSNTEKTLKRAMLTKSLGEHPAMLMLRQTLAHRIELCKGLIIARASDIPQDQDSILRYAMEQNTIATRKADYEWFLKLFEVAEARVEVINNDLGGRRKR